MERLIADLEDATQNLPGRIKPDTVLTAIDGWDSIGVVAFISALAERYPVDLPADSFRACVTVADVHEMLQGLVEAPVTLGLNKYYPAII